MTQSNLDQLINDKVLLIAPQMHTWGGRYELGDDDTAVLLDGKTIDSRDVTTPAARLFTKAGPSDIHGQNWSTRIGSVQAEFRRIKEKRTLKYNLGVARILPAKYLSEFLADLFGEVGTPDAPEPGSLAGKIAQLGQDMAEQYDELVDYWSQRDYWSYIADRVPAKESLRKRFRITITTLNIGVSDGVRKHLLEREATIVAKACRSQISDLVATMIEEPRKAIVDEIEKINTQLRDGGRITSRSFNAIREAIDKFRMFDFLADAEVLDRLADLESRVETVDTKTLSSSTDVAALFSSAIKDIGTAVAESIDRAATAYSLDRSERFIG